MGNAQPRPPGSQQGPPGSGRTRGGSFKHHQPPSSSSSSAHGKGPAMNGTQGNSDQGGVNSTAKPPQDEEEDQSYLDAPAGSLPPPLARLKNQGNKLFKNGQFGDALDKYTQCISGCQEAGIDSTEDLCILYSNRAACYLKDGNSADCIADCTKALDLQPFSLKPLLRRAMAYESLERYRKAYVDFKTVLQVDVSVQAAHDSIHRITKLLIEQDGPNWREKLPDIPVVPLSSQQHRREEPPSEEQLRARAARKAEEDARRAEVRFNVLKQEGNELVKKGRFQDALEKYTECLQIKPNECAIYTNRALCYLRVNRFQEAKLDCDSALAIEPANKKAFYRRALASKGLKDYLAASTDLQEVLQLDPNVQEAEQELEQVTLLFRQSLMSNASQG